MLVMAQDVLRHLRVHILIHLSGKHSNTHLGAQMFTLVYYGMAAGASIAIARNRSSYFTAIAAPLCVVVERT